MDPRQIINGLILYLGLLVLLTFHEFGHAWMAWKCGDDTAYSQGRVSLNPLVHIDPLGTVALPLLLILLAPGGFLSAGPNRFPSTRTTSRTRGRMTSWSRWRGRG